jgi:hypothetical protein
MPGQVNDSVEQVFEAVAALSFPPEPISDKKQLVQELTKTYQLDMGMAQWLASSYNIGNGNFGFDLDVVQDILPECHATFSRHVGGIARTPNCSCRFDPRRRKRGLDPRQGANHIGGYRCQFFLGGLRQQTNFQFVWLHQKFSIGQFGHFSNFFNRKGSLEHLKRNLHAFCM